MRPNKINGYTLPIRFTKRELAQEFVDRVFPTDYIHNMRKSAVAGYDIFCSTCDGYYGSICDLGDRFEVNFGHGYHTPSGWENQSLNVWFDSVEC